MARSSRRPRMDRVTTVWMLLALAAAMVAIATRNVLPQTWWTTIHLVTLGVLTNGIMQWSWFFARSLLRLPLQNKHAGRDSTVRSMAFNVALVGLIASMWLAATYVVVAFATVLGAVVAWHGLALVSAMRQALGSRFAPLLRFYVAAAGFFVIGCAIAGFLSVALTDPHAPTWLSDVQDGLALAHVIVMGLGWIGLSIVGTLVTLGPTVMRTRMDDSAAPSAMRALPWLAGSVLASAAAILAGSLMCAGAFLSVFAICLAMWIAAPLVRGARRRGPREFPAWSMTFGLAWIGVGLVVLCVVLMASADAASARNSAMAWIPLIGAGGFAQLFIGALSYLLPVVVGGGPSALRMGIWVIETYAPARLAVRNGALVLLALTVGTGSPARWAWWLLVAGTFLTDIALMGIAGARQSRIKRATSDELVVLVATPLMRPLGTPPGAPGADPTAIAPTALAAANEDGAP